MNRSNADKLFADTELQINFSSQRMELTILYGSLMVTKIIFITGTDTGVGKTLLTALLLCHLRSLGARVLALKPFCSGGRADAELLHRLQDGDLTLDEVNPFYFPEPVAPLISARKHNRRIRLDAVVDCIQETAARLSGVTSRLELKPKSRISALSTRNFLLVEGSGGLLVPLGEGYTVRDLIAALGCDVLVVARNRLGTINHTLLTVGALDVSNQSWNPRALSSRSHSSTSGRKVVFMDQRSPDVSSRTNPAILRELLKPVPLVLLPYLGQNCLSSSSLKRAVKRLKKALSTLL